MQASARGYTEIVPVLLEANADKDLKSREGNTALICACEKGNVDIVRVLLEARANHDDANRDGNTALICACEQDHVETTYMMLEAGARKNVKNKFGKTALHCAGDKGHVKIVHLLVEAGAYIDLVDSDGNTALVRESMSRRDCTPAGGSQSQHEFKNRNSHHAERTAVMWASAEGHVETVRLLLELGAKDHQGIAFRVAEKNRRCKKAEGT